MCTTAIRRKISDDRYRRYAAAKSRIPKNLTPAEHEAAIKKLAKKYGI